MTWNLAKIKAEIRLVTGVYNDDLSDARLIELIQEFWRVTMPAKLKLESQKDTHRFLTRKGLSIYPMPQDFVSLSPEAFIENASLAVTYDASVLAKHLGHWYTEFIAEGNGTMDIFTHELKDYAEPTSICIFSKDQEFFWGNKSLSYNYENKSVYIDLPAPLEQGAPLFVKYRQTNLGQPHWLLIQDDRLTLLPTPQDSYMVEVSGLKRPDPLPEGKDASFANVPPEYMNLLVYGVALKIFSLTDTNGYNRILPIYIEAEKVAMAKTHQQLLYTQVQGI